MPEYYPCVCAILATVRAKRELGLFRNSRIGPGLFTGMCVPLGDTPMNRILIVDDEP
jgi:hypothetical protein